MVIGHSTLTIISTFVDIEMRNDWLHTGRDVLVLYRMKKKTIPRMYMDRHGS